MYAIQLLYIIFIMFIVHIHGPKGVVRTGIVSIWDPSINDNGNASNSCYYQFCLLYNAKIDHRSICIGATEYHSHFNTYNQIPL